MASYDAGINVGSGEEVAQWLASPSAKDLGRAKNWGNHGLKGEQARQMR